MSNQTQTDIPPDSMAASFPMLAPALDAADQGWDVFPCWERDYRTDPETGKPEGAKSPRIHNGHLRATRNPDLITQWWGAWYPNAMIGARVPDPLAVIDLDPRNGGSLKSLWASVGPLPTTLTVWSGRNDGGHHLYFQRPGGELTGARLPDGIDLKVGGKGYVIIPPSLHPVTGLPYEWEHHPIAVMPGSLRAMLRAPVRRPEPTRVADGSRDARSTVGLIRVVRAAKTGERNAVLYWAACRAHENGVLDDAAADLAKASGLGSAEAHRTIESARRATL